MITYQVELWSDFLTEAEALFPDHWREVATHQDTIKLAIHYEAYAALEAQGKLHVVTVRDDGGLIGYHVSLVAPHLHYVQSLTAVTDVYYVQAAHRKGLVGYRLFQYVERTLRERGVERMFTSTKLSLDMGRLFERLGWAETERVYAKSLREG